MPPRLLVLAITLFWAATTGWLVQREVWPRLRSGQPPPYTIDLADETLQKGPKVTWSVFRGDRKIGVTQTWIAYRDWDDTFELHSEAAKLDWGQIGLYRAAVARNAGAAKPHAGPTSRLLLPRR